MKKGLIMILISCICFCGQTVNGNSQDIYIPDSSIRIIMITQGQSIETEYLNCGIDPICREERIFIPIRPFAEYFGYQVGWDDTTQTVTVEGDNKVLSFKINDAEIVINGEEVELLSSAFIEHDRAMVPVRSVAEIYGLDIRWMEGLDQVQYVWLSAVSLLDEADLETTAQDFSFVQEADLFSCYTLTPEGATKRGIQLGDSCDKVFRLYGKPAITKTENTAYILEYTIPVLPYTDEVGTLTFFVRDGVVTEVEIKR